MGWASRGQESYVCYVQLLNLGVGRLEAGEGGSEGKGSLDRGAAGGGGLGKGCWLSRAIKE